MRTTLSIVHYRRKSSLLIIFPVHTLNYVKFKAQFSQKGLPEIMSVYIKKCICIIYHWDSSYISYFSLQRDVNIQCPMTSGYAGREFHSTIGLCYIILPYLCILEFVKTVKTNIISILFICKIHKFELTTYFLLYCSN